MQDDVAALCLKRALKASSEGDLAAILFHAAAELGFKYIWCGAHADPDARPAGAALIQNYPANWVSLSRAGNYFRSNPIYRFAESSADGFCWEDEKFLVSLSERQIRFMVDARRCGLANGFTFALSQAGFVKASCSLIPANGEVDHAATQAIGPLVWTIYGQALLLSQAQHAPAPKALLSPRERDCLHLKAKGASVEDIAASLGISASTVRRHLEQAQIRLSANSRAHAVALALRQGQIS